MTDAASPMRRADVVASLSTLGLAVLATSVGLFVPGFYRDAPALLPQSYGQDLLTLTVAVPVLAASLYAATRGSLRGYVVRPGVMGYLLYTYAAYSVLAAFNELYLVYVALFALTLFTLVDGVARVDPAAFRRTFGGRSVRAYVAFQALVAVLVAFLWLSELVPATPDGTVPASAAAAGLQVNDVQSLDLGVVVPAFALSAYLLWRGRDWAYVFTGVLLVKATTLGLAVVAMILFMRRAGQTVVLPQVVIFVGLSLLGLVLTGRYVRAVGAGNDGTSPAVASGQTTEMQQ